MLESGVEIPERWREAFQAADADGAVSECGVQADAFDVYP
jgi:hypothetical protein